MKNQARKAAPRHQPKADPFERLLASVDAKTRKLMLRAARWGAAIAHDTHEGFIEPLPSLAKQLGLRDLAYEQW